MATPVVTVASGGLPVVESTTGGAAISEAANGFGIAVTKVVGKPGWPVVYVTDTGSVTPPPAGLIQKRGGSVAGNANIVTSLPGGTTAGNAILIFANGAGTIVTPAGFTSRSPQVNNQGLYLFDKLAASGNATDTPTLVMAGAYNATWQIVEYSGITALDGNAGSNAGFSITATRATPALTPTAGTRLVVAVVASSASSIATGFTTGDPQSWTNAFAGQQSNSQPGASGAGLDSMMSGWSSKTVAADGTSSYSTTAGWTTVPSNSSSAPSCIIAAYRSSGTVSDPFPNAATTGIQPPGTTLTSAGFTTAVAGTTYTAMSFNGGVDVPLGVNNVTFNNCKIFCGTTENWAACIAAGCSNITFQNCEVYSTGGASATTQQAGINTKSDVTNLRIINCNIHDVGHGIDLAGGGVIIQGNWIHNLFSNSTSHYDCVFFAGGNGAATTILISGNNLDNTANAQTGACYMENFFGGIYGVTIDGNKIAGGGYALYFRSDKSASTCTGNSITNNAFITGFFGYDDIEGPYPPATMTGNYDYTTRAPITLP